MCLHQAVHERAGRWTTGHSQTCLPHPQIRAPASTAAHGTSHLIFKLFGERGHMNEHLKRLNKGGPPGSMSNHPLHRHPLQGKCERPAVCRRPRVPSINVGDTPSEKTSAHVAAV
eukprot:2040791-Amphidinium_carterae.1